MAWQDFLRNNSQGLTQAGIGLLSGQTPQEQFAMGAQGFMQGQQANRTAQWVAQNAPPELAQAVKAGVISPAEAFQTMTQAKTKKAPLQINGKLVDPETYQVLADFSGGGDQEETFFGNPIPVTNQDGSTIYGQIGNRGSFRPIKIGEGQTFAPPVKTVDTGTGTELIGPGGVSVRNINKDIAGEAAARAGGTALGGDQATLASIQSKMPGLEQTVSKLDELAEKATYTKVGRLLDTGMSEAGMEPRESAIARAEYIATVDNQILPLLRDTFGAQFTQKEGETLRATLGDPDKSPKEKQAVLRAFIEQKRRDVEGLAVRTGAAPAPAAKRRVYNPATGMLE